MQRRNRSNIVLAASAAPSAVLFAYVLWYTLVYRPSGQEAWGDAVSIFYLGALTYPLALLLLTLGTFMAVRWRRRSSSTSNSAPAWFALSLALMVAPFIALFTASHVGGA